MAAQGTPNYVYFVDQQLGLGASGNVYLGRHKVQHRFIFYILFFCFVEFLLFVSIFISSFLCVFNGNNELNRR